MILNRIFLLISLPLFLFSCAGEGDQNKSIAPAEPDSTKSSLDTSKLEIVLMGDSVKIGTQVWMTRNLSVKVYRNGDPIHQKQSNPDWEKQSENKVGVYGFIMNKPELEEKYGLIYNWYAVNDPRGLAPEGWRVPTEEDWQILIDYLGGYLAAGQFLKSTVGWSANGNGNNKSGFSAVPGGFMGYYGESYQEGFTGGWWTTSEISEFFAKGFSMVFDEFTVKKSNGYKFDGFSLRCIK